MGPDQPVGLAAERSFELVVGLLGILKAGGAYVPLDPSYPAERLAFMMADARLSVLVGTDSQLAGLPGAAGLPAPSRGRGRRAEDGPPGRRRRLCRRRG